MKYKVFVDGQEGTTGLEINERLSKQPDIELIKISSELRKDNAERAKLLNLADIVFLCLPDEAARQAVSLVTNPNTRIIDASTAHRTQAGWVYGFAELDREQRDKIRASKRIAVPGCYATGFTAAVHPLRVSGVLSAGYPLCCNAVSGYSGGGKKLIEKYEQGRDDSITLKSPRFYALGLSHKHLPEMAIINGLEAPPLFTPIVGDFKQGMLVSLPLSRKLLDKKLDACEIHALYRDYYKGERFISVMPFGEEPLDGGFLDATGCNGTNRLEIFVFGHDDKILIISRLDNLGKGASGAAVQCMNIVLGQDEGIGL